MSWYHYVYIPKFIYLLITEFLFYKCIMHAPRPGIDNPWIYIIAIILAEYSLQHNSLKQGWKISLKNDMLRTIDVEEQMNFELECYDGDHKYTEFI